MVLKMKNEIYDNIIRRRSIRMFKNRTLPYDILEKCVDAARLAPSGGNLQPCEYIVVDEKNQVDEAFTTLKWANYLENGSPPEGMKPVAYIVILLNRNIKQEGGEYDVGMAAENIMLTAFGEGVATCCIGSIEKKKLRKLLSVPRHCDIELVIALGYPAEVSVTEDVADSIRYWKENGVLHVPKRKLSDILHKNFY